jgi:broad specificity phosphatase PhoE
MSITLFVGRHGTTKLNSEERLRGWIDVPLNEEGVKEAEQLGVKMSKTDIDKLYSSDLDRADKTAVIVGQHHNLKPILRTWFRPLNYGSLQGRPLKEIQADFEKLNKIWETEPDYQVEGGESFQEFQDRNLGGLHAILKSAEEGEQVMLIAHLRNLLLFHGVATLGHPLSGKEVHLMIGKDWTIDPGDVARFEWNGSFEFKGKI